MNNLKAYLSELIGTFCLVFCGTGAIVINEITNGSVTHVGIAITFGLIVMAMIYSFGKTSGAHINPAVTLSLAVNGNFEWSRVVSYILVQLIGASLASLLLKLLFPTSAFLGATLPAGAPMQSFALELVLTFVLMLVILQVSKSIYKDFTGFAVGGIVLLEAMFAGPICGASMNPARSFAPAIMSNHLEHLWIYLTTPVFGALLATLTHRILQKD